MCGPTTGQKSATSMITNFATTATNQAAQIFGNSSQIFNNLMSTFQNTVAAGPGQAGWGAAETNAVNSQIVNQAASSARNEKSAVGNAVAAIGGGNQVNPSGLETAVNLQTSEATEAAKSQQLEQATEANFQQGNQNYNNAVRGEEALPSVYGAANQANQTASGAQQQALTAQNEQAQQNNWWQPIVMGAVNGVLGAATAGLSGAATQYGKNVANNANGGPDRPDQVVVRHRGWVKNGQP